MQKRSLLHHEIVGRFPSVLRGLGILLAVSTAPACGPIMYDIAVLDATGILEEARQAGAPTTATYEYYYALEHLNKAREEAGETEYQRAQSFANVARQFGTQARDIARRRARESGR